MNRLAEALGVAILIWLIVLIILVLTVQALRWLF